MATTAAPAPAPVHNLRPAQAKALLAVEQEYRDRKADLETAKEKRKKVRDRYRGLVPIGVTIVVAGIRIRISKKSSGSKFSLSGFREAGHKITAAMAPFVSGPSSYEDWSVHEADGGDE